MDGMCAVIESIAGRNAEPAAGPDSRPTAASGTRHVSGLLAASPLFAAVCRQARVLEAVAHVLQQPFRIAALHARDPLPGYGLRGLHADWRPRQPGESNQVATALWLLDDFTLDNGATRVVPGSHHSPIPPPRSMAAPSSSHPQEEVVLAAAGSVLVFNGHLWHRGGRNDSRAPRRVLQCSYVPRDSPAFPADEQDAAASLHSFPFPPPSSDD